MDTDEMWKKPELTKEEALLVLEECDHSILVKDGAIKIAKPFGLVPELTKIQDRRSEFKGAYFADLKEGEWATDCIDATELAIQLCNHEKVEYQSFHGRGSQLRGCIDALQKSIK